MAIAQELKDYIAGRIRPLVRWTRLVRTNASGADEVEPQQRADWEPQGQDPARRWQHYGFRSSPPAGAEVLTVAVGGSSSQRAIIASELPGAGPQSQPPGDAEIYVADGYELWIRANGATVKISKTGAVTVDAAAGQDVVVNGGTLRVARDTDPVKPTADMSSFLAAVATAVNTVTPGAITPVLLAKVQAQLGLVDGGAAHLKA